MTKQLCLVFLLPLGRGEPLSGCEVGGVLPDGRAGSEVKAQERDVRLPARGGALIVSFGYPASEHPSFSEGGKASTE